jgi:hypothetical protein
MKTHLNSAIYAGILDVLSSRGWNKRGFSIGGGGGKKEKSESKQETVFKDDFLTRLFKAFPLNKYSTTADQVEIANIAPPTEGQPGFSGVGALGDQQQFTLPVPKFRGLDDMDFAKLETNLNTQTDQRRRPVYERERARNREELSQAGLINSPAAFAKGGALENLQNNYFDARGKAATDIGVEVTRIKQQELARKTGFEMDLLNQFNEIYNSIVDVVLRSGGTATSRSTGSTSPTFGLSALWNPSATSSKS